MLCPTEMGKELLWKTAHPIGISYAMFRKWMGPCHMLLGGLKRRKGKEREGKKERKKDGQFSTVEAI